MVASADALAEAWPKAVKHLQAALDVSRGTHTPDDIFQGITRGQFQMWVGNHSAGVTEVVTYPQAKCLRFFLAGGDMEELSYMEQKISAGAKKLGFTRVEIGGRRGLLKALKGYKELCTYMSKDL